MNLKQYKRDFIYFLIFCIYAQFSEFFLNFKVIDPKEIQEKIGIAKGDKLILDLKENKIIITKF